MFFAAIIFATVVRVKRPAPPRAHPRTARGWLILPGVLFAGDLMVWHWSFRFTNLANATLLANLSTVVVVVIAWFWFRERFGGLFLVGAAVALVGTMVLLNASFQADPATFKGDMLGMATALFYGSYLVSVKILRRQESTLRIMLYSCVTATPLLLIAALVSGERVMPQSLGGWGAMVGLAVVAHGGGQALIAYALAHLPASFSAVTLLIQPLSVAVLQWVLFDQVLTRGQMLGGVVLVAGIALARLGATPKRLRRAS